MSATNPPSQGEETLQSASGPGQLLRSARESAGISVRDVAGQLRLDERTITALETDDFTHLPAPTFVRGYLRGYARLLGVPVGPVMDAYDREGFGPPGLVADISEAPQANASDFPVRITTVGVIAVLAVLVVMWWNNQAFDDLDTDTPGIESARQDAEPAGSPETQAINDGATAEAPAPDSQLPPRGDDALMASDPAATGSTPSQEPEAPANRVRVATPEPASPQAVDQVIERAQSVLAQTRDELDAMQGVVNQDGTLSTAAPATTDSPQAVDADAGSADTQTAAEAPASPLPAAPSADGTSTSADARLVLEFPVESWVEVYARDDARLFYGLVKPGRTLDLTGRPPMRVLLGRTDGVRATYNGEGVDLGPHTEKGVARFTLGR